MPVVNRGGRKIWRYGGNGDGIVIFYVSTSATVVAHACASIFMLAPSRCSRCDTIVATLAINLIDELVKHRIYPRSRFLLHQVSLRHFLFHDSCVFAALLATIFYVMVNFSLTVNTCDHPSGLVKPKTVARKHLRHHAKKVATRGRSSLHAQVHRNRRRLQIFGSPTRLSAKRPDDVMGLLRGRQFEWRSDQNEILESI